MMVFLLNTPLRQRSLPYPKIQIILEIFEEAPHHGRQVNNMGRLVFRKQLPGLLDISEETKFFIQKDSAAATYVKSASFEEAKIHFSSCRFSSLATFSSALPTKPVPPVTRITLLGDVVNNSGILVVKTPVFVANGKVSGQHTEDTNRKTVSIGL